MNYVSDDDLDKIKTIPFIEVYNSWGS